MRKKTIAILLIVLLAACLISCGGGTSTGSSGGKGVDDANKATTLSGSLEKIMENKNKMYNKLSEKMPDDMVWASMDMLKVSLMDIQLAFVIPVGGKEAKTTLDLALGMFGYTNVQYSEKGATYQVSATGKDGKVMKYDVEYDKNADSVLVKFYENDKQTALFESVRIKGGYGFVYTQAGENANELDTVKGIAYDTGDGKFTTGILTAAPASIYKQYSAATDAFVAEGMKNSYEVKDGKCHVVYDGKTYDYEAGAAEAKN